MFSRWQKLAYGFVLLALILGLIKIFPSHAANLPGINLEISPLPIEVTALPGKSVSTDLRVKNAGNQTETLKVTLQKFKVTGETGQIELLDPAPSDEFIQWVTFSRTVFEAPPNEWQTVKMTINFPTTAALDYYYAVKFQRANPAKAEPGKPAIEGSVVSFVLAQALVPGAIRNAEVASFSADHKFYEFLPTSFNIKVRNTGNVHLAPHGDIFIMQGNRQIGDPIPINAAGGNILPNSNRIFAALWEDGFPHYVTKTSDGKTVMGKNGQPAKKLQWDFTQISRLRLGHYTAKLVLAYDNGTRDVPIEGTLSFWVIPWRIFVYILLIIATPALIVYVIMRRKYHKYRIEKPSK